MASLAHQFSLKSFFFGDDEDDAGEKEIPENRVEVFEQIDYEIFEFPADETYWPKEDSNDSEFEWDSNQAYIDIQEPNSV